MQKILLIIREIFSAPLITLLLLITIVISVFSIGAFLTVGDNVNRYIKDQFAESIPPNTLKVTTKPRPMMPSFGIFKPKLPKGSLLNEYHMDTIAALEGVKRVDAFLPSKIPLQAMISIFGLVYRTDLIVIGVPYLYIRQDIKKAEDRKQWRNWEPGNEIPVIIPKMILNAYNNSMAEPNGMPRITEDFATGQRLEILFGKSYVKELPGYTRERARSIGFSDRVQNMALLVPLSVVIHYNRKFLGQDHVNEYMFTYVQVEKHEDLKPVIRKIEDMGYIVQSEESLSEEIIRLKKNIDLILKLLSSIIIFMALIAIAFSTSIASLNRLNYYRILRILGSSRVFIIISVLLKFVLIGYLGTEAGIYLLNYTGTNLLDSEILKHAMIPDFQMIYRLPEEWMPLILKGGVLIPVISSIPSLFRLYFLNLSSD